MKSHLLFVFLLVATGAAAEDSVDANSPKTLLTEVRKLRIELLAFRIEAHTAKVSILEQALRQIDTQRLKLAEKEGAVPQQIANIDAQFSSQNLTPDQRAEVENLRTTFAAAQAERLGAERSSLAAREAEISGTLRIEQQGLQALQAKLNELMPAR